MLQHTILLLVGVVALVANVPANVVWGESAYVTEIKQRIAAAGGDPVPLLGPDDVAVLDRLEAREEEAGLAKLTLKDISGDTYRRALRIDVERPASVFWKTSIQATSTAPVKKGDVIWVVYQMRGGEPGLGGSEAVVSVVAKPGFPPYEPQRGLLGRRVDLNDSWQTVMLSDVAKEDLGAGQLRFDINVGYQRQWVEVAGVMAFNLGPNADRTKLPVTATDTRTTYEGREPDAPWRKAAAERIAAHRQAPLAVRVIDADGHAVADAEVSLVLQRHDFKFGTALDGWLYMADTPEGKDLPLHRDGRWQIGTKADPETPDARRYREEARRLFNMVAPENDLKGYRLLDGPLSPERSRLHAQQFVRRLNRDGFDVYGHVLVWPGFAYSPKSWKTLASDPAVLREAVERHVRETVMLFGDQELIAWDVVNEPYGNHDLQRLYGRDVMAEWFAIARELRPDLRLHLNEAARPGTKQVEMRSSLHEHLKLLKGLNAPVTGVGLQSHYGHPPSIEAIKAEFDAYAAHGVDVWITEFDIYASAPDAAAREALEADFLRDFYTLCYSHPAVRGVTMWGFWDGLHWKGRAPIFRKDWSLKPSGQQFLDLVHGQWKTRSSGRTDATGRFATTGHLGEYEVTVTVSGKTFRLESASLVQPGSEWTVRID